MSHKQKPNKQTRYSGLNKLLIWLQTKWTEYHLCSCCAANSREEYRANSERASVKCRIVRCGWSNMVCDLDLAWHRVDLQQKGQGQLKPCQSDASDSSSATMPLMWIPSRRDGLPLCLPATNFSLALTERLVFFLNSLTNRARWGSNEIASALSYRALWHGKREWEIAIDSSPHTLLFARDTNVLCGRQNESWSRDLDLKKHEQKKSLEAHSTNIDCGGDFTHHLPRVSLEALAREGFAAGQPEDLLRENHES